MLVQIYCVTPESFSKNSLPFYIKKNVIHINSSTLPYVMWFLLSLCNSIKTITYTHCLLELEINKYHSYVEQVHENPTQQTGH